MSIITLKDVLADMTKGKPFDITYVKADRSRRVAGKMRSLEGVVLHSTDRKNSIRRVLLPNGKIRPIHIRLIVQYNNQRVIY